jgi:hypothetical protein
VLCRPEELDPLEEAEEQRRIAERRKQAADVRDQEDEDDHRVRAVLPRAIGAQHRPHQQDEAPVVPVRLAIAVPKAISAVLVPGVPRSVAARDAPRPPP